MKPNKYNALEFCRRTIKSCTTIKQLCNAHNLVFNFKVMFDDLFCSLLLRDEWWDKYEEICNKIKTYIREKNNCKNCVGNTPENASVELKKLSKAI